VFAYVAEGGLARFLAGAPDRAIIVRELKGGADVLAVARQRFLDDEGSTAQDRADLRAGLE